MRRSQRRHLAPAMLAPLLALGLLAACGGDGDQQVATEDGTPASGESVWAALADGATTEEEGDGDKGEDGADGEDGEDGADGEDGEDGADAGPTSRPSTSTTGSTAGGSGQGGGSGRPTGSGSGTGTGTGGGGGGGGGTPPPTTPPPVTTPPRPTVYRPTGIDATGRNDVSQAMAGFFASVPNGSTIEIPPGTYRMERTLVLERRSNLVIRGSGATFIMTTRGDLNRSNVRVLESDRITIEGLAVRGANPAGGSGTYVPEVAGQHGFDIDRSNDITLSRVVATDTYGDFIYVGSHDGGRQTQNVTIRDCRVARSGRQGITVTSARNVLIQGCTVSDVTRSVFDLEPGRGAGLSIDNVRIVGNRVERGRLLFVAAHGHGPVNNITVDRNTAIGMPLSIWVNDQSLGIRRGWTITGNRSDFESGNPNGATMQFVRVDGLVLRSNHQVLQPGRNMVMARTERVCNIVDQANSYPGGVGSVRVITPC